MVFGHVLPPQLHLTLVNLEGSYVFGTGGKRGRSSVCFPSHPQGILKLLYMNSDILGLGLMLYGQVLVYSEHYTGV